MASPGKCSTGSTRVEPSPTKELATTSTGEADGQALPATQTEGPPQLSRPDLPPDGLGQAGSAGANQADTTEVVAPNHSHTRCSPEQP